VYNDEISDDIPENRKHQIVTFKDFIDRTYISKRKDLKEDNVEKLREIVKERISN